MENKEEFSAKKIIIEVILYIALILVCIFIIPRYVVQRTKVVGSSMENTLHQDDNLLVEKVTYKFKNPDRFDIIVFYPYGKEEDPDDYYVEKNYWSSGRNSSDYWRRHIHKRRDT